MNPYGWDEALATGAIVSGQTQVQVWAPDRWLVVLGRSNRAEAEVHLDRCRVDGVPVVRRRGGGGAVVLGPGCLVVGVAVPVSHPLGVATWLGRVVEVLADELSARTGLPVEIRGAGDLCVGNRKVLGSSAFGRRGVHAYQGSLLVGGTLDRIDRYLSHPSREPVYRAGRPHRAFLTTLEREAAEVCVAKLKEGLQRGLDARLGGGGDNREPGPRCSVPEKRGVALPVGEIRRLRAGCAEPGTW